MKGRKSQRGGGSWLKLLQIIDAPLQTPAGTTRLSVSACHTHTHICEHTSAPNFGLFLKSLHTVKFWFKTTYHPYKSSPKKTLIKIYSAAISDLFIMQKQRKALWMRAEERLFCCYVSGLCQGQHVLLCFTQDKIFIKMKGAKFQGWQGGGRKKS